ncbi:hypothetical protein HK405_010106, partial [Cladochytrium tenue]
MAQPQLLDLGDEVLLRVLTPLHPHAVHHLRCVCRRLRDLIDAHAERSVAFAHRNLLAYEPHRPLITSAEMAAAVAKHPSQWYYSLTGAQAAMRALDWRHLGVAYHAALLLRCRFGGTEWCLPFPFMPSLRPVPDETQVEERSSPRCVAETPEGRRLTKAIWAALPHLESKSALAFDIADAKCDVFAWAAACNDLALIDRLMGLLVGPDGVVISAESIWNSSLNAASAHGSVDALDAVLAWGARHLPSHFQEPFRPTNALLYACLGRRLATMKYLLEDAPGREDCHVARVTSETDPDLIETAADGGEVEIVAFLVSKGWPATATTLARAAQYGRVAVLRALDVMGVALDADDDAALVEAVRAGQTKAAMFLLGDERVRASFQRCNALRWAVIKDNEVVVDAIVSDGLASAAQLKEARRVATR